MITRVERSAESCTDKETPRQHFVSFATHGKRFREPVRHALADRGDTRVGQDEAVFMLGACASFASYLWRKHVGGQPS